jgi:transglutaminase-like putative cysteine protease
MVFAKYATAMTVPGFGAWRPATTTIPLADGVRGTAQTIGLMRRLIDLGVKDPRIRRIATEVVSHVASYDDQGEIRAMFAAVIPGGRLGIRFVRDMVGRYDSLSGEYIGKETLQPPHVTLETGAGDCDDINGILLPALLGSIGYPTRAVTIAPPQDPENFSHIYLEVEAPPGSDRWIPLDAAREGAAWGNTPNRYGAIVRWPLTGGAERLSGMRARQVPAVARRRFIPRFGLGAFDWSTLTRQLTTPQDISAITGGVAQIIGASRTNPNILAYGPGYGAGVAPYGPGIAASTQVSGSSNLLLVGGLIIAGVFGLVLLSKR